MMNRKRRPGGGGYNRGKKPRKSYVKLFEGRDGLDYKDVQIVEQFITERGRIIPRRITGLTAHQQRQVTQAVKRARVMALIPFTNTQHR